MNYLYFLFYFIIYVLFIREKTTMEKPREKKEERIKKKDNHDKKVKGHKPKAR